MAGASEDGQLASVLAALPSLTPDGLQQVMQAARTVLGAARAMANMRAFTSVFGSLVRNGNGKRAAIVQQYKDLMSGMRVVDVCPAQDGWGGIVKLSVPFSTKAVAVSFSRDEFSYAAGTGVGISYTLLVCFDQKRMDQWAKNIYKAVSLEPECNFNESFTVDGEEVLLDMMKAAGIGANEEERGEHILPFLCVLASPLGDACLQSHMSGLGESYLEEYSGDDQWFSFPEDSWGAPHTYLFSLEGEEEDESEEEEEEEEED